LIPEPIDGIRVGRKENSANRTKRGFDFNSAVRIFAGTVREYVDPRPWNEQRIVATGQVEGRFITIVYTRRNNVYRIISARVARSKERF
jgi:uncharacterized protein